jgi:hypothetical protein
MQVAMQPFRYHVTCSWLVAAPNRKRQRPVWPDFTVVPEADQKNGGQPHGRNH